MPARIPVIKVADDANHFGIWRPDGKTHAADAFVLDNMSAQCVVTLVVSAFAVEIQIEVGQERLEPIGIVENFGSAFPKTNA
jgi:hypothetical protein